MVINSDKNVEEPDHFDNGKMSFLRIKTQYLMKIFLFASCVQFIQDLLATHVKTK